MIQRRSELVARYNDGLSSLPEIERPRVRPGVRHAWHLYAIRLRLEMLKIDRAQFIECLKAEGIGTSVHFIPLHRQPYYRDHFGLAPSDYPVADAAYQRLISLPLFIRMTERDVDDVVEAVRRVVQRNRCRGTRSGQAWETPRRHRCRRNWSGCLGSALCRDRNLDQARLARTCVLQGRAHWPVWQAVLHTEVSEHGPERPPIGHGLTAQDDRRITRVGKVLRKTKLDELPSLVNVLKGEMSLVGPRPESPSWVERYTPQQRAVLTIKPGITGWAQIKYRNEENC